MDTDSMIVIGGILVVGLLVIGYLLFRQSKTKGQNQSDRSRQQPARNQHRTARNSTGSRSRSSSSAGQQGPWHSEDAHASDRNQRAEMRHNWLLGRTGAIEGLTFHIGDRMASIGRGVSNYIQVSDETASERHALLMGNPQGLMLTDLESSNGTFVNGDRLDENVEYELYDGDEIKIGDSMFLYRQQGRYTDDTQKHQKQVDTQEQTKAAMSIENLQSGGDGAGGPNIKQQVLRAVENADGDYEKAAEQLDLDIDIIQRIVQRARNE